MDETDGEPPESLLPYGDWIEEAQRHVAIQALQHASVEGLPGGHHFYVTFRTDYPGVVVPARVLARYPQEMTIVLQHQYWDLKVDRAAEQFSVGLSFGGVGTILVIPFGALIGFADPYAQFQLHFDPLGAAEQDTAPPPEPEPTPAEPEAPSETPQVVSLDSFRRRTPPKE